MRTSFDVNEDLWNKFNRKVFTKYGNHKLGYVINQLIRKWLNGEIKIEDI